MATTDKKSFLEKYRLELEKDVAIDRASLKSDLYTVASLQAKWINYYAVFKEQYIKVEKRLKEMRARKYMQVIEGTAGVHVTKSEAKYVVAGDKDIVDLEEKIEMLELALAFFIDAQKIVRDKSFIMSNIIRLEEFEAGVS